MFIEFPELLASIYVAERLGRHAKSRGFSTLRTEKFSRDAFRSKEDAAT